MSRGFRSSRAPPDIRRRGAKAARAELRAYFDAASRYPLLTKEEEVALARRARAGDDGAVRSLVLANLRFTVKVAVDFSGYNVSIADLVQEGNIGLLHAVKKFDPERGIRLISYAVWWIRAYIQNYILKSWSLVKLGTTQAQRKLFFSLARTRRELEKLGEGDGQAGVNVDAIAQKLRVKPQEVREMEQRLMGDSSTEALGHNEEGESFSFEFPSTESSPEDQALAIEGAALAGARVREVLDGLSWRERVIVKLRLMADEPTTRNELGELFGCSRERVRQIELKLSAHLREALADLREAA